MENKINTRIRRRTFGLAYITREVIQKGEELPFQREIPYLSLLERVKPFDWSKKVGQVYYRLHYLPNYPSFEDPKVLLLMKGVDRRDHQDECLPKIELTDFGEGKDQLFLSFDCENMDNNDWYRRGRLEGKRLDIISGRQEDFYEQIPGSGGMTSSKRFISTAIGALTYQKDIYDNLIELFIDQNTMPFAAIKRKKVGWVEGNEYQDGYPEFEFVTHEYDGKSWGEPIGELEPGFHFRRAGKISTLSLQEIVLKMHEDKKSCKKCLSKDLTKKGYHYELIRLPGYGNSGIILGHDEHKITSVCSRIDLSKEPNKVYEVEMKPRKDYVQIISIKELPLKNVTHISPVSSRKVNDTLLGWVTNPETNPYMDPCNWIYRAG